MSKDAHMARLRRLGRRAASRLVVRSALNPMILLCAINTPSFLLVAYAVQDHAILSTLFGLMAAVPVVVTCVVAVFFGVSKTENLRSGGYQLRREVLQRALQKGDKVTRDALSRNAITNPEVRPMETGERLTRAMLRSFLLVSSVARPNMLPFLNGCPEVANWMFLSSQTVVVVSEEDAVRPREITHRKFPSARFIVAEMVSGHKDGWLGDQIWDFINNPAPAEGT